MKKLLIILAVLCSSGCASVNHRIHENHRDYFRSAKKVVLAEPDIKLYQLSAGGVDEYKQDWSDQAHQNILKALQEEVSSLPLINLNVMDEKKMEAEQAQILNEQKAMFNAVSSSIITHTYDPMNTLPDRKDHFQYTFGSDFSKLNQLTDAQAVLFTSGRNYIWTKGRVMMYLFAAAVFGENANYIVPVGNEYLLFSIVDQKTGDVIWFNYLPLPGDLRNPEVVQKQIKKMFKDFRKEWVEDKKK